MPALKPIQWQNRQLVLLDQTCLPNEIIYRSYATVAAVHDAIRDMVVRGAPAIGVSAAYGMVLAALAAAETIHHHAPAGDAATQTDQLIRQLETDGEQLAQARPTAVNLRWAIGRMLDRARSRRNLPMHDLCIALEQEAVAIHQEDVRINRQIGENLLNLLEDGATVLTHCNAGALAASAYGTALAPIYLAQERGRPLKVFADETRPRLQGARLTAFELYQAGVDVTLISDNMAAVVMSQGKIDAVIVGCDRIAANGDTANKIGTFGVSVLACQFGIPFYIAAPTPTIDLSCPSGSQIPIEERDGEEITRINGEWIAPPAVKTYNPSFDVTPADFITAIVTERGIARPPFTESLRRLFD
jgi:methylthioribose-1-phosphate isomerase